MSEQRWRVGAITITSVVEEETLHIPPEFFLPDATAEAMLAHEWARPDFVDDRGFIGFRIQAFVVETPTRCIMVDPCVGNGKPRLLPFWNDQHWPFFERFTGAGFTPEQIDVVLHTHMHADHVGWDTRLDGDVWVPTFTGARHLYTERELEFCRRGDNPGIANVYDDSVAPIFAAGLADMVEEDANLGEGLQFEPSPGHTPGHVSLWIESDGERALITGDFLHHPVQCAVPEWAENGDEDPDEARVTRRRMLTRAAETRALVLGTHFCTRPAGRVVTSGDAWRFEPET